jgi:dephospho-CoA kinase
MSKRIIIGLTGLIGSGKSVIANIFAQLGAAIIDTDAISHQLTTEDKPTLAKIASIFGKEYLTQQGLLDREKMRQLIFANEIERLKLEKLLHERIYQVTRKQLDNSRAEIVVLIVPLLFKVAKFRQLVDYTLFVDCDMPTIYQRLKQRNNFSPIEVNKIIETQMPRAMQIKLADEVITNNGSLEQLKYTTELVYNKYAKMTVAD